MGAITEPPDLTTPTDSGVSPLGSASGPYSSASAQLVAAIGGTANKTIALLLVFRHADRAWSLYEREINSDSKPLLGVAVILAIALTGATFPQVAKFLRWASPWGKGGK